MLGQEKQGSNYGIRLLCNNCIHSYKVSSKHLQSCEIWGCCGHSCSARWFACSGANLYAPGWESLVLMSRFKSSRCWKKNCGTCFVGLVGGLWGFVFVVPVAFCTSRYCPHSDLACAVANLCKTCLIFFFASFLQLMERLLDWAQLGTLLRVTCLHFYYVTFISK